MSKNTFKKIKEFFIKLNINYWLKKIVTWIIISCLMIMVGGITIMVILKFKEPISVITSYLFSFFLFVFIVWLGYSLFNVNKNKNKKETQNIKQTVHLAILSSFTGSYIFYVLISLNQKGNKYWDVLMLIVLLVWWVYFKKGLTKND